MLTTEVTNGTCQPARVTSTECTKRRLAPSALSSYGRRARQALWPSRQVPEPAQVDNADATNRIGGPRIRHSRGPLSETCDSRARSGTDTEPDGSARFTRYRIRSITQLFGQARGWWLVCIVPGERPCSPLAGTKLNGEQPNRRRIVDHLQCHRRVQMSGMTSESPRPVCAR